MKASTENMKGPSKKMEKVVKIKCEKLKGRKKALPRMDRSTRMNRALKPQIRALYEKINIMISEYKHLQRRWNLFSNIECARKAFIMLHTILYHQCRQHEDHDIDIYLQYGAEYKSNFDLKVRITAPSSGGPLCCTFRPTETVAATSVSTKQGIECLCALLSQPIIPTLSLQYGGTLASQLPDKVIRVEMSLPVAGKYLRRRKRLLVQLAQQIATAVLNLHCTPCESMIWTCENLLLFFEKEKPSEEDVLRSLDKLHFRVHLRKSTLGASDSFESNEEGVFFSFGLVLYELWTFLRLPGPRPLPINKENMRLEHRQRLLEVIHKQVDYWVYNGAMLQEYAELIEWCLRTPIREIGNMGESKMYDRVICQLEKIGERYISAKDGALLVL